MEYFGITDKGGVRKENQDSFIIRSHEKSGTVVAVLCDGMGGANAGDVASDLATKEFISYVFAHLSDESIKRQNYQALLKNACTKANGVVFQYSSFDDNYSGMGTTLVAAIVTKDRAYICNIGDSRAYHINKKNISQITKDHSYVQMLVDRGEISPESAKKHPKKNVITNALGFDDKVFSDYFEVKMKKGDRIFLCSDGVSNLFSDENLKVRSDDQDIVEFFCKSMIDSCLELNSPDNVTVVTVQV